MPAAAVGTMPVIHATLLGTETSFSISQGRITNSTIDGFMVETETPDRTLTPDERLTISRELVDILVGWIRNGFTPTLAPRNYLRLQIYGIPNREDLEYIRYYLYREIHRLNGVFGVEFIVQNWIADSDGSRRMDLITEIALTEDVGVLMMEHNLILANRPPYCIDLNIHTS